MFEKIPDMAEMIVDRLDPKCKETFGPCLRCIGNITSTEEYQIINKMMDKGLLDRLAQSIQYCHDEK